MQDALCPNTYETSFHDLVANGLSALDAARRVTELYLDGNRVYTLLEHRFVTNEPEYDEAASEAVPSGDLCNNPCCSRKWKAVIELD